jgi:hypothetical protein
VQKQGGSVGGSLGVLVAAGGDVGVSGMTGIGVLVGCGGTVTRPGAGGTLEEVGEKMIRVLVGVGVGV